MKAQSKTALKPQAGTEQGELQPAGRLRTILKHAQIGMWPVGTLLSHSGDLDITQDQSW